jgi:hypothetical protein
MLIKNTSKLQELPAGFSLEASAVRVRLASWQMVALASLFAGIGNGWKILGQPVGSLSPLWTAAAMMLVTFAGWYAWGFFTHLTASVFFGGHSDYRGTLDAFGPAYAFQALVLFSFTNPLNWLWSWIALYVTIAVWGVVGPRRLGMRTWQAIVAAALGMLPWLALQLILSVTLVWDGLYTGFGAFLI